MAIYLFPARQQDKWMRDSFNYFPGCGPTQEKEAQDRKWDKKYAQDQENPEERKKPPRVCCSRVLSYSSMSQSLVTSAFSYLKSLKFLNSNVYKRCLPYRRRFFGTHFKLVIHFWIDWSSWQTGNILSNISVDEEQFRGLYWPFKALIVKWTSTQVRRSWDYKFINIF